MIAFSAAAMSSAKERWIELIPVVQKLETSCVLDRKYLEYIFQGQMRSARMDSVRIQFTYMVSSAMGPWGFIAWQQGKLVCVGELGCDPRSAGCARICAGARRVLSRFPFLDPLVILRIGIAADPAPPAMVGRVPATRMVGVLSLRSWGPCWEWLLETQTGLLVPSAIVPATVVVAWLALALSTKWKAEPSWIDRSGRLLGLLWAGTIPIYLAGFVFS